MLDLRLIIADGPTWLGEVDVYESAEIVARFNAVSTWELVVPAASGAADLLAAAAHPRLVVTSAPGVVFRSGPVSRIERDVAPDGDLLTITGIDDLGWLRGRVAHPQPGKDGPPYSVTAHDIRSGSVAEVIAQYVDANAGPGAVASRRVPGLTVPTPAPLGPVITGRARYQNLLTMVTRMANRARLGIEVRDLVFSVFDPIAPGVVFSQGLGTLAGWFHAVEMPEVNYVYVAGRGWGTSRVIYEDSDDISVAEWGRWEGFVDQRDAETTEELAESAAEALAEIPPPEVEVEALDTDSQAFGVDYGLGDVATAYLGGETFPEVTEVIRQVTITLEANTPPRIVPTLGGRE